MTGSVKPLPEFKKRKLSSKQQLLPNFALGKKGEEQAIQFLVAHKYLILDQNVQIFSQEIDIIALDPSGTEVVFIEVKTRSTSEFGHPSQAVNHRKVQKMRQVAEYYLQHHKLAKDYRFDIISVLPNQVEHFENVTW